MIAELISVASFVLMVAETCYMIKIYNMVKSIRPSGNERVPMEYARANQRALPLIREPAVCFPIAESSAEQRGTPNYITYDGLQVIRRQPQMHDERFAWQSKKCSTFHSLHQNKKIVSFFRFLPQRFTLQIVSSYLPWPVVILYSRKFHPKDRGILETSFRVERSWEIRNCRLFHFLKYLRNYEHPDWSKTYRLLHQ